MDHAVWVPARAASRLGRDDSNTSPFPARKKLIPGLESGLIFYAPCSFEGVVDRDA